MEKGDCPQVSPEGFCGRFERCSSSLIEEPEYKPAYGADPLNMFGR